MPPHLIVAPTEPTLSERHIRILDAAEHVFARAGFHTATMQDVAAEAGMSPGNLYRYFNSKDAIIAGMAERDRSTIAADFAALCPSRGPLLDQLEELGRKHLVLQPREKAVIALQIWAEAARKVRKDVIVLVHGGPVSEPDDAAYVLSNTSNCHGFYGASSMERLPTERALVEQTRKFKAIKKS